jgi:ribosomal protein S18 acetylase RimI-like enzyme
MKQQQIRSYQEVLELVNQSRIKGVPYITNFYPDETKIRTWIDRGQLSVLMAEGVTLMLRTHLDFQYLFFLTAGHDRLEAVLPALLKESGGIFVADVVAKGEHDHTLHHILIQNHFRHHETLIRMTARREISEFSGIPSEECIFANRGDISKVYSFLMVNLDRFSEQIPDQEEISDLIDTQQLLLISEREDVGGLLYFEKNGATSHLREWLVNEKYRDKHYGSRLIREYFRLSSECSRFILWVKEANHHAIEIYRHYGYTIENLTDRIFVNT